MAERGLQATSVPSARAGQQTDPAARRDALSGLITGGFLLAVIAITLAIVIAAPQYAEPALAADEPAAESVAPSLDPEAEIVHVFQPVVPTSAEPGELKGYKWPVKGGQINTFYEYHDKGVFQVDGKRIHDGLLITWFEGAPVKAAHKGKVVAAGRDWAKHVGFDELPEDLYQRYAKGGGSKSKKPAFPLGVVIDDGNGYYSIYTELKDLQVKPKQKVKPGQLIGRMSKAEGGKLMMRYRLVRMDGKWMQVSEAAREKGYPDYARERIDPLAVLSLEARKRPKTPRKQPKDPPRQSDY